MNEKIKRQWYSSNIILDEHSSLEVRQVSAWIFTYTKEVVLVSKDGIKWTIPGGHPELNETIEQSLNREILEESGINISNLRRYLLGYYLITETNNGLEEIFLQLRYKVDLDNYDIGNLTPSSIDEVKFVKTFKFTSVPNYVKWANESNDYNLLLESQHEI